MNPGRALAGPIGIMRVVTLILGIIVLVLTGIAHYEDLKEQLFLSIVVITLFVSFILLVILILDKMPPWLANTVDMSYHLIGGILLLVISSVMVYSVFDIGDRCGFFDRAGMVCPYKRYIPRIIAAVLGVVNGFIFLFMSGLIRKTEYI